MKRILSISAFALLLAFFVLPWHAVLGQGAHSITLSWSAGSGGGAATTYNVKRSTSTGTETQLASVPASTTTYVDTAGVAGTKYFYVVTAVNSFGESGPSNEVAATFLGNPPATPVGVTAVAQ